MEKRQAVEFLEYLRQDRNLERTIYGDALNMAIEALKAQLSHEGTTSDTISRQAAIDMIDNQIKQCSKALGSLSLSDVDTHAVKVEMASLRAYRKMLENLPTIQPEPHEGHWIWVAGELMCSECRTIYSDLYPDYDNAVACPHCGARMKGERQK